MCVFVAPSSLVPSRAAAEKVLVNVDGWQVFTDGRAGGFASYAYGDGYPQPRLRHRPDDGMYVDADRSRQRAAASGPSASRGWPSIPASPAEPDPRPGHDQHDAGPQRLHQQRLRLRRARQADRVDHAVGATCSSGRSSRTTAGRRTSRTSRTRGRARRSWKVRGELHRRPHAGAVLARRHGIDVLYAHRWGVGWPGALDNKGPSLGMSVRRPRQRLLGGVHLRDALARGPAAERRRASTRFNSRATATGPAPNTRAPRRS